MLALGADENTGERVAEDEVRKRGRFIVRVRHLARLLRRRLVVARTNDRSDAYEGAGVVKS